MKKFIDSLIGFTMFFSLVIAVLSALIFLGAEPSNFSEDSLAEYNAFYSSGGGAELFAWLFLASIGLFLILSLVSYLRTTKQNKK